MRGRTASGQQTLDAVEEGAGTQFQLWPLLSPVTVLTASETYIDAA
jgi:hypothetical protein